MGQEIKTSKGQFSLPGFRLNSLPSSITNEKLPTNVTTNRHAVHRWFNFVAGFSPEFVERNCPIKPNSLILDPFAGCGTTLVVARALGHRAIGFEPHPFFARIARAKAGQCPTLSQLQDIEAILQEGLKHPCTADSLAPAAGRYLLKLFEKSTLEQLLGARDAVKSAGLDTDDTSFLVLSRVIELCSKSKIDGIYKAPLSSKVPATPNIAIKNVVRDMQLDIQLSVSSIATEPATVVSVSSESMGEVESASVDAVVTSPPYLNNFDYAEMTRMYLYFWEICRSWQDITEKVRSKLIVNTTTALQGHRELQTEYRGEIPAVLLPELDGIVNQLSNQRRVRAGKKEYDKLIFPYFAQMAQILREVLRCLRDDSEAHIVIGDAALYGIHISTPQFLAEIMSQLGYQDIKCIKLRDRGQRWILKKRDGSPTGLGEYHLFGKRSSTR